MLFGFELNQCLFGEHQLLCVAEKHKPIAIVEADKTAVIASALMPEFIWMSAGAKGYLNASRLSSLSNRKVILFPDANAFDDWTAKAKTLRPFVPSLRVSDYLETRLTDEQKKKGYDIADFLIEQRRREIWERELYNQTVDAIKSDENLAKDFCFLIEERKAVMMFDGNLSRAEAERLIYLPENIQPLVLNLA